MGTLIIAIYAGLFIFAINGLVLYKLTTKHLELKVVEEEIVRKLMKMRLNRIRGKR